MYACEYLNMWLKNLTWMLLKTPQKLRGSKKEAGMKRIFFSFWW